MAKNQKLQKNKRQELVDKYFELRKNLKQKVIMKL